MYRDSFAGEEQSKPQAKSNNQAFQDNNRQAPAQGPNLHTCRHWAAHPFAQMAHGREDPQRIERP